MADPIFDDTDVTFAATSLNAAEHAIQSVTYTNQPAKIEISGADDATTKKKYGIGRGNKTTTVVCDGHPVLAKGAKGALVVKWADGGGASGPGSMDHAVVAKRPHTGSRGGKITTTYTFRPSRT